MLQAEMLRVNGGGIVHATTVNIEAESLIVDDLGEIIGDLHNVACSSVYSGVGGSSGSGIYSDITVYILLRSNRIFSINNFTPLHK